MFIARFFRSLPAVKRRSKRRTLAATASGGDIHDRQHNDGSVTVHLVEMDRLALIASLVCSHLRCTTRWRSSIQDMRKTISDCRSPYGVHVSPLLHAVRRTYLEKIFRVSFEEVPREEEHKAFQTARNVVDEYKR